jgi:hypothetical protein
MTPRKLLESAHRPMQLLVEKIGIWGHAFRRS